VRILPEAQILNPMYLLMSAFSIILHVFITCFELYTIYTSAIMVHCQDTIIIFCVTIKMDDLVVSNGQLELYRCIIVTQTTVVVWNK